MATLQITRTDGNYFSNKKYLSSLNVFYLGHIKQQLKPRIRHTCSCCISFCQYNFYQSEADYRLISLYSIQQILRRDQPNFAQLGSILRSKLAEGKNLSIFRAKFVKPTHPCRSGPKADRRKQFFSETHFNVVHNCKPYILSLFGHVLHEITTPLGLIALS